MKKVSIIIVTYNSEKDIFDCVSSIRCHADIPLSEIELIIVDNKSNAPQPMFQRLREEWGDDIVLIENECNGGYGQGNNVGIRRSTAPVIMIMNPDVRLVEGVFSSAVERFAADDSLGVYGMKQMLSETKTCLNSFAPTFIMNGYMRILLAGIWSRMDWYWSRYMYFSGACFFIRKSMFERIGLYDESNFMYGEENDIHYRLRHETGCRMSYNPHLHYIHLTEQRQPTLKYEIKKIEAIVRIFGKRGVSRNYILRQCLRSAKVELLRAKIKGCLHNNTGSQITHLEEWIAYLRCEIQKK